MNNYDVVGLYNHNRDNYDTIKERLKEEDILAIIQATGTGKSYLFLQLAYDNKHERIVYIAPSNSIIEHIKEIINNNPNLDLERDFPNLEFRTYQSLTNASSEELENMDIDMLVLDEFHHIGAPVWGSRIDYIVDTHPNMKIIGMTAYTVRDRGTSYERDMTDPDTDELFSGKVVTRYDLTDAIIDGVLPKPIYKSGYVYLEKTAKTLEEKIEKLDHESKNYKELLPILKSIKQRIHEAPSIKDIFKTNIKKDGKYIYFCPPNSEDGKNDIKFIMEEAKKWVEEMGLSEDEYEFYVSTSDMGVLGNKNRLAFYNDEDLNGNKTSNKLRIMFSINQYNEGVHAPGLDGVIMGRGTTSDIVFFEQLGRGLSVRGRNKEEYEKLYSKSIEELISICKTREIPINKDESKEEIIEKILAPVIIDLANNIDFIKNLENDLKDRIKIIQSSGLGSKRKIHVGSPSFDITMLNEDLYKILEYMNNRLTMTWMDKYELAKNYYKHYGNLEVLTQFKTIDGITYDENGVHLGKWISTQREASKGKGKWKITSEQIELLKKIGMRFEVRDNEQEWNKKYELAKKYYEHHGNLEIPDGFKTIDGITHDENGIFLGKWISTQRQASQGKGKSKITSEQIELLKKIGMRFEVRDNEQEWNKKYELAKLYYEHHGNLEISRTFKTIDGITYNEKGIALGSWISDQRQASRGKGKTKITSEQIELLKKIGMRFEKINRMEEWMQNYELAKKYYEHYGNLEIPKQFKTIDGITYDENGFLLSNWVIHQRRIWQEKDKGTLTEEQIELLKKIGMRFENINRMEEWMQYYELAKKYYKHHGNLKISKAFKTIDGITYDENGVHLGNWIDKQKVQYKGQKNKELIDERQKLLEDIGMIWMSDKIDEKLRTEEINDKNNERKQIELLSRLRSFLNSYGDGPINKEDINQEFLDTLDHKSPKK